MISRIKRRLTYTNIAVTVGLVFAMAGGAYAAKHYVITSTKQISPSVLKKLEGKAGKEGARGPVGAAGVAGAPGTPGKDGNQGSVGPQGPQGTTGSPWTAGGTLPPGQSLSGQWNMLAYVPGAEFEGIVQTSVSFDIPLSEVSETFKVHYVRVNQATPEGCTGEVGNPGAEPGNLCVFAAGETNSLTKILSFALPAVCDLSNSASCVQQQLAVGRTGFGITGMSEKAGPVSDYGSWAVTAELGK